MEFGELVVNRGNFLNVTPVDQEGGTFPTPQTFHNFWTDVGAEVESSAADAEGVTSDRRKFGVDEHFLDPPLEVGDGERSVLILLARESARVGEERVVFGRVVDLEVLFEDLDRVNVVGEDGGEGENETAFRTVGLVPEEFDGEGGRRCVLAVLVLEGDLHASGAPLGLVLPLVDRPPEELSGSTHRSEKDDGSGGDGEIGGRLRFVRLLEDRAEFF